MVVAAVRFREERTPTLMIRYPFYKYFTFLNLCSVLIAPGILQAFVVVACTF